MMIRVEREGHVFWINDRHILTVDVGPHGKTDIELSLTHWNSTNESENHYRNLIVDTPVEEIIDQINIAKRGFVKQ